MLKTLITTFGWVIVCLSAVISFALMSKLLNFLF